jgi:RNA polymerase sigma-70 factor (ECF subfamily)
MPTDDRQLLIDTHRGHEASARLLWARHAPRLTAHARVIVRDAAADVVQTVLCRLLELPARRIRAIDDVPAFLAAAVRREALNHLRAARRAQARRRLAPPPADPPEYAPLHTPDLQTALNRLPRRLREVVVLKHVAELTFDQIAAALATNRNTVASRYRSAVAALRTLIQPVPSTEGAVHV